MTLNDAFSTFNENELKLFKFDTFLLCDHIFVSIPQNAYIYQENPPTLPNGKGRATIRPGFLGVVLV